jgi:hypothetical protein
MEMSMRLTLIASSLSALLATAAYAAAGDPLVVTGDGVNVREQPDSRGSILVQVYRNEPATELAREGDWVEVELTARNIRGWIHQSLVAPVGAPGAVAQPAPALPTADPTPPEPAIPPTEPLITALPPAPPGAPAIAPAITPGGIELGGADPFSEFRKSVQYLNNRALTAAGVDLFSDVRSLNADTVQVVTTDAWATVPQAGQQSYLNALYNSWLLVAGPNGERTVQIVDPDGDVVMEKSGP